MSSPLTLIAFVPPFFQAAFASSVFFCLFFGGTYATFSPVPSSCSLSVPFLPRKIEVQHSTAHPEQTTSNTGNAPTPQWSPALFTRGYFYCWGTIIWLPSAYWAAVRGLKYICKILHGTGNTEPSRQRQRQTAKQLKKQHQRAQCSASTTTNNNNTHQTPTFLSPRHFAATSLCLLSRPSRSCIAKWHERGRQALPFPPNPRVCVPTVV
eukprot:TRINITY_DN54030_c0_g1_i1.p1 TRINITY_DN54030_c0_g1~~TRINITY_DN54030_c0_g1_i1.p1  ORF type:complete len:209 (-),score=12.92 TRINITY_DN54030_c0_g1_i1:266-892(-)